MLKFIVVGILLFGSSCTLINQLKDRFFGGKKSETTNGVVDNSDFGDGCIALCMSGDDKAPKLAGRMSDEPISYCIYESIKDANECLKARDTLAGKDCEAFDSQNQKQSGKIGQIVWAQKVARPKNAQGDSIKVVACPR